VISPTNQLTPSSRSQNSQNQLSSRPDYHRLVRDSPTGVLTSNLHPDLLKAVLAREYRWWSVHVGYFQSKEHFLRYAGRYTRRPPIAQHRFEEITDATVRFSLKDKRLGMRVSAEYSPADFVALLAEHVPDRYRHVVRYFGLLAPRSKGRTATAIFLLLGQQRRSRPRRLGWAYSRRRDFGNDPLIDSQGQPMHWVGRLSPCRKLISIAT